MPADWCKETSQKVMHARIWPQPAARTLEIATRSFGASANFTPPTPIGNPATF
jgi:hypothetical protein